MGCFGVGKIVVIVYTASRLNQKYTLTKNQRYANFIMLIKNMANHAVIVSSISLIDFNWNSFIKMGSTVELSILGIFSHLMDFSTCFL